MSFVRFKHLAGTAGYSPVAADVNGVLRKRTKLEAREDLGVPGAESAVSTYTTYSIPTSGGWRQISPTFSIPANYLTPGRCLRLSLVGSHGGSGSALEDVLIDGVEGTTYLDTSGSLHKTVIEILCVSSGVSGQLFVSYLGSTWRSQSGRSINTTQAHTISLGTNTNAEARTAICYLATMETIG